MAIAVGDTLPEANMLIMGDDGAESVSLSSKLAGRKVALFAIPGPYTGTCTTAHVPSFIQAMDALKAKGADEVVCVSVADPFVMEVFGQTTGATEAGITMLADSDGSFAKAMGRVLDVPAIGFHGRSTRYALFADDGVVKVLLENDAPGTCDLTTGSALADQI